MMTKESFREDYRLLGLRISYYRKRANLTQAALADKVGCSQGFLSRIEANNGKKVFGIALPTLFRMATILEVPVSKLLED